MARVSYVEKDSAAPEARAVYEEVEGLAGRVLNPFRALAHSPKLLERWWRMMWTLMTELALDPRLRELAILRVFQLTGCEYCFAEHEAIARRLGVPREKILALETFRTSALFDGLERTVLEYAEAITRDNRVGDGLVARLRERLSERELVELTFSIANWNGLSRFIVPLGLELETEPGR